MFKKILVANRGAIARRIVRACTELGVQSVVVYSPVDIQAPYIAEATEAYPLRGDAAVDGYLDQDQLLAIAHKCRADGIHPGYGFLSENSAFAQRVIDEGLALYWTLTPMAGSDGRQSQCAHSDGKAGECLFLQAAN